MTGPAAGGPEAARLAAVRALRVAQEAAAHVPAYARFLRQHGYDAARLRSFADFCALPVMDKDSYLRPYPLAARCLGGEVPRSYIVISSSGTSGAAMLWPRLPEQEPATVAGVRAALEEHFQISQRWSLVVIAAAMGPWAYGTGMTLACQRIFAGSMARGSIVTPGQNPEEVLRFIEQLSPQYDQTILVSYPGMVAPLLEAGERQGIVWPKLNLGVVTAGEGATEAQREHILRLLGKDPERLEGFVNMLGASEVGGILGYETRLCLLVRRLCHQHPDLATALFGTPSIPSLHQYNPLAHYLQYHDGEVLLTLRGAAPLVRYNTHDRGGLLAFDELVAACRAHGYDLQGELRARGCGPELEHARPFVYIYGRSDAVILHGGNLYLDDVAHVLERPAFSPWGTGAFELSTVTSAAGKVTIGLAVELREGVLATEELRASYEAGVLAGLLEVSPRFKAAYEASQGRTTLQVSLVPFGRMEQRGPKQWRVVLPAEQAAGPESHQSPAYGNE